MKGFQYHITVETRVGPHHAHAGGEVFSFDRWAEPETMYEIVRRLRWAYSGPEYAVLVDIVDTLHTRVIDEGDKLP